MPARGAATAPIRRHPVDADWCRERAEALKARLAMYEQSLAKDVNVANALRIAAEQRAGYLDVVSPGSREICDGLRLAAAGLGALFAAAITGSRNVRPDLHDAGNWLGGLSLAQICRDDGVQQALAAVPIELLRSSTTRADEYAYLYVQALRAYLAKDRGAPALLLAALKATDPAQLTPGAVDYVLNIVVPQMEILFRIMDRDAAGLTAALAKALQAHRDYWAAPEREADPRGYVSFPLLALAGSAHDAGLPIEVASDYLPPPLVEGVCRA
jgi:immunity protein 49 of polymorphic toxin system